MLNETIKQLLEAGVHFGHQTKRWNPKMEKFIFGERNGIYIIDLEKTAKCLEEARNFLKDMTSKGEIVLFSGTKRQAQDVIKSEAIRCNMPYVNKRWLGGLLTNFSTIQKSVQRLKAIEQMRQDGTFNNLKKKEVANLTREMDKLRNNLAGILEMEHLPKAIFIIDTKKEETAVREAQKLGIVIIALLDTNCNPEVVTYPIPGNDDAMKSIKLITSLLADSVVEGRKQFLSYLAKDTVEYSKEEVGEVPSAEEVKAPEEKIIEEYTREFEEVTDEKETKPHVIKKKAAHQPKKTEL